LCSWCLWKALNEERCMGLVPWHLDLWCKSSWILNDFFTKITLNHSWEFRRNWNVLLVLLERSWWAGFNGIYLVRFGFRMWEILILKWFSPLKIQINSQFWKEKSVEDVVTLGPMAQAILVPYFYKEIITKEFITTNCSQVFFFPIFWKKIFG
jgi:hypothetical protein